MFLRFLSLVRSFRSGWAFWGEAVGFVNFFELLLILLSFKHILRLCDKPLRNMYSSLWYYFMYTDSSMSSSRSLSCRLWPSWRIFPLSQAYSPLFLKMWLRGIGLPSFIHNGFRFCHNFTSFLPYARKQEKYRHPDAISLTVIPISPPIILYRPIFNNVSHLLFHYWISNHRLQVFSQCNRMPFRINEEPFSRCF